MPKFLQKSWYHYYTSWACVFSFLFVSFIAIYNYWYSLTGLFIVGLFGVVVGRLERDFYKKTANHINELSFRIKRVESNVTTEVPFGVVLYDDDKNIEWHNNYVSDIFSDQTLVGFPVANHFPKLFTMQDNKGLEEGCSLISSEVQINQRYFQLLHSLEERFIYIYENTKLVTLRKKYEDERLVLGIIVLDNIDEMSQGMDDQQRTVLIAKVTSVITQWAKRYKVYLRRLSSDRYLMMLNFKSLQQLEETRFVILDAVREMTVDLKVPMTLSIGIAFGTDSARELGELAQSSVDIALGRGGDQVAIKSGQRLSFYGGKSNALEKRTRVRARVIAHALRDLIQESDRVIIMGHKEPDMDAIGAAIGVWKAAHLYQVEAKIMLDESNPCIDRLMDQVGKDVLLSKAFITPSQSYQVMTEHTLLVVVDTHKTSMTMEPQLVKLGARTVVIDHHRRSEEFINDAVLVYLEPYASSTSELVTELLQYIHEKVEFRPLEATALLAGITVDTKHFALHTGSRTFEAAGFLRRCGADTITIQRLLREDLKEYLSKSDIIKNVQIIHEHVAIAVADPGKKTPQLLIAQVADTLLNMTHVSASFVISERPDGLIGISARSLEKINVQVIMERLGGGGHLTNAAVQLESTIEQAEYDLKEILYALEKEEGFFT